MKKLRGKPGGHPHNECRGPSCRILEIVAVVAFNRSQLLERGRSLEYFTVAYNTLEGVVSLIAGLSPVPCPWLASALSSPIEVTSGAAILWRLHHDWNVSWREAVERMTLRIVGLCFVTVVYVAVDSGWTHETTEAERSILGMAVAAVSVIVMPHRRKQSVEQWRASAAPQ